MDLTPKQRAEIDAAIRYNIQELLDTLAPSEPMLRFFQFKHLPAQLAEISMYFAELAGRIVSDLPRNPERTVALRKLLEAKDCAVRTALDQPEGVE